MRTFLIILFLLLTNDAISQPEFLDANTFGTTYKFKFFDNIGTCFTLRVYGKVYFVTARHLFQGIQRSDIIADVPNNSPISFEVQRDTSWMPIQGTLYLDSVAGADVAVIVPKIFNKAPIAALEIGKSISISMGDEGYFLGYPFNYMSQRNDSTNTFPVALVKRCVMSGAEQKADVTTFLLDGHNNPGFSGGPVLFKDRLLKDSPWFVVAVISGYADQIKKITTPSGLLNYTENTGIILSVSSRHIYDIIGQNKLR